MKYLFNVIFMIVALTTFAQDKLAGTNWNMVKMENGPKNYSGEVNASCGATLSFGSKGMFSGFDSCNNYSGEYTEFIGGKVVIGTTTRTKKMCLTEGCRAAEDIHSFFPDVVKFEISGNTLTLITKSYVKLIFTKK